LGFSLSGPRTGQDPLFARGHIRSQDEPDSQVVKRVIFNSLSCHCRQPLARTNIPTDTGPYRVGVPDSIRGLSYQPVTGFNAKRESRVCKASV